MNDSAMREEAIRARKDHAVTMSWIERYRAGDPAAGNVLVIAHTPMVMSVAQRFARVGSRDWEDCIQEGSLGILKGAETFDAAKGDVRGHLWAWIRSRVGRYVIDRCQAVRLPCHLYTRRRGETGAPRASVWKPIAYMFCELVENSHDRERTFEENLLDQHIPADEELSDFDHELACKRLAPWMLWHLTPRNRKILQLRFGEPEQTLQEIGDRLGVSRERIRQLEDEALDACWGIVPPAAHETFDAWVARALGVKEQREALEAERVAFIAKQPERVTKIIRRRRAAPQRGAA